MEAISTLSAAYPDDGDGRVSDAERALGDGQQDEDDDEDSEGGENEQGGEGQQR